jgi:hypothetical protein
LGLSGHCEPDDQYERTHDAHSLPPLREGVFCRLFLSSCLRAQVLKSKAPGQKELQWIRNAGRPRLPGPCLWVCSNSRGCDPCRRS